MRVCYHGSRTLGSLVSFYDDVTEISQAISNENKVTFLGLKTEPLNGTYLERIGQSSDDGKNNHPEEFASAGDIFGLGHCIRAFEVALFPFTNSVCMYLIGLETVHPEYEGKELVGTSSGLSESSNPVIQFPKGALQEK
ncbi:hypothetical protein HYC85_017130 [Camellia sinensis]|uniref:Uncharacterized protein n=1 Tax=Camellia sinensis TaxID=4442 RepID=A0A7J7H1N6_CAMSI|nr:hypothetical protein HYC85_017130 [Camellia sinensis]